MPRTVKPKPVRPTRSTGDRDYFIDPERPLLGEYFVDKEGRKIFTHRSGPHMYMHYYFGPVKGFPGRIFPITVILTPPQRIRSAAYPPGGQNAGSGMVRSGVGNGNYS